MRQNRRAFTLIELLVTIVLFSLLLATALYSFRFISINIRHINNTNPQRAMNFNFLKDIFSSTYFYIDTDRNKKKGDKRYFYYFNGDNLSCRFTSNASLFYNELVVAQLTFKDSMLLYKEGKIFTSNSNYQNLNDIELTQKIKILENIEEFSILYTSNGITTSKISRKIPNKITINFKSNKKSYRYFFTVKSTNTIELESLIRNYELISN
jgi:prepilin-type N-terminal cleavage/methylation domain-containing protein